jgi:hypothetical protein
MDFKSNYLFRHPECTFVRISDRSTCTACYKSSTPSLIIRRCESEAGLWDGTIHLRKTPNARLAMSLGLSLEKMSATSKELRPGMEPKQSPPRKRAFTQQTSSSHIPYFLKRVNVEILSKPEQHPPSRLDEIDHLSRVKH